MDELREVREEAAPPVEDARGLATHTRETEPSIIPGPWGRRLITEEEMREAQALIDNLLAGEVSATTVEELEGYKKDLAAFEFEQMDLENLRDLHARLSKGG